MASKTTVKIGKKTYPIKCNIEVLMDIQDEFDSLTLFEMALLGFKPSLSPDGSVRMDETGKPLLKKRDPSLRAIVKTLPLMLKAGANEGTEVPEISMDVLDFDYVEVANSMHDAFSKCFERKNP